MKLVCQKTLCAVFLAVLLQTVCFAQQTPDSARTLKIGYFFVPGFQETQSVGQRSGYCYEYLQRLKTYTGWHYEYVGYGACSWREMMEKLENGEIDLLAPANLTAERQERFSFSARPIGTSCVNVTVKAGDTRYDPEDFSTWNGMTVGMLLGSSRNNAFAEFAKEKGFSYETLLFTANDQMTNALQTGQVDALASLDLRARTEEWVIAQFDAQPFYFMVQKGNDTLLRELDAAMDQLALASPALSAQLHAKYYPANTASAIPFTAAERAYIDACRKNGTVFLASMNPDCKPYSYFENGIASGVCAALANEIIARTGLDIRVDEIGSKQLAQQGSAENEIPIRLDMTCDYAYAEETGYLLSDPYFSVSISKLTRKAKPDNEKRIGFIRGTEQSPVFADLIAQAPRPVYYASMEQCAQAVVAGEIDAAYFYTNSGQYFTYRQETNSLTCIALPQSKVNFSIGICGTEDHLLASIVNKSVQSLRPEEVARIVSRYMTFDFPPKTMISILHEYPEYLLFAVMIIAGLLASTVCNIVIRRKNAAILTANEKLAQACDAADRANHTKNEFISRVSHDMRTPLHGVIGLAELAQEKTDLCAIRADLGKIGTSAGYLLGLVNDMLDIGKMEAGKFQILPAATNLRVLLADTTSNLEMAAQSKGVGFTCTVQNAPIADVWVDALRVRQVLTNLLSNAVKFTPAGGSIVFEAVFSALAEGKIRAAFLIKDTGIGMDPAYTKHIFEAFSQENRASREENSGTGLGMAIVKQLVELMQGEIELSSAPNVGTEVRVRFAWEYAPKAEKAAACTENFSGLAGKHILLCEDHPINTEIALGLLQQKKIEADHASNGQLGVERFCASPVGFYDAILMDVRMPVLDGRAATKAIRALPRADAATVPIIALTASEYEKDKAANFEAGMNAHLSKPLEANTMFLLLNRLCGGNFPVS